MRNRYLSAPILLIAVLCLPHGDAQARNLSIKQRIRAEAAIARVNYADQVGATRSFKEAAPRSVLAGRVRLYLEQSAALGAIWNTPITAEALRAEAARMSRQSRSPDKLRKLYAALGNDPFLIQECLARPALAGRLTRNFFTTDAQIHSGTRRQIDDLRERLMSGQIDPRAEHPLRTILEAVRVEPAGTILRGPRSSWVPEPPRGLLRLELPPREFAAWRERVPEHAWQSSPVIEMPDEFVVRTVLEEDAGRIKLAVYSVRKITWDEWWASVEKRFRSSPVKAVASGSWSSSPASRPASDGTGLAEAWDNGILDDVPDARSDHAAVWTGSEMIVWGGQIPGESRLTGSRYDPATDTWRSISTQGAPGATGSAVWTGNEMIVWTGTEGGRYDPVVDRWTPVSRLRGVPSAAIVWTGLEMLAWNGTEGGRYDPATDSWKPIATLGAPSGSGTAIWTGREMLVWSGDAHSGGRYDPLADRWRPISMLGAPISSRLYTTVWTGSEMIVWGGTPHTGDQGEGARYDPKADAWKAMSTVGAPGWRYGHTAVWTGLEMIVWAGYGDGFASSGGRYDPVTDTWASIATANGPGARLGHSAVWTGTLMIVWGGTHFNGRQDFFSTGGRYDPLSDMWTPTATTNGPEADAYATAVWTGSTMIVWNDRSGGRYDPVTDSWSLVSTRSAPAAMLGGHIAVWTGESMIVVADGGFYDPSPNPVGRYDPIADAWTPISASGQPSPRFGYGAVWTGSSLIIWGGNEVDSEGRFHALDSGGLYDPAKNTWRATSTIGAPAGGSYPAVIWAGGVMTVWGGGAGGRYDPVADAWTPISSVGAPEDFGGCYSSLSTDAGMILWGPCLSPQGERYDPVADAWTPISEVGSPSPRFGPAAVWTGEVMILWGGTDGDEDLQSGGRYDPSADMWQATTVVGAPAGRSDAVSVWSGSAMIVWGGGFHGSLLSRNSGGRYFLSGLGNRPPVARAGEDVGSECASPAGATVTLDGSGSSDPDSSPGTSDDIVSFDWFENFGTPSETLLGMGAVLTVTLPLGPHAVTLRVTDRAGTPATDDLQVSIVDTGGPSIAISLDPSVLWPPNHKLVAVHAGVLATDACTGISAVVLESITSSEATSGSGTGDDVADILDAALGTLDLDFSLRAERSGSGPGRIYTITYSAVDALGNRATGAAHVLVPHDQR